MNKFLIGIISATLLSGVGLLNWLKGRTEVTDRILYKLEEKTDKQQEEIHENELLDMKQSILIDKLDKKLDKELAE